MNLATNLFFSIAYAKVDTIFVITKHFANYFQKKNCILIYKNILYNLYYIARPRKRHKTHRKSGKARVPNNLS